MPERIFPFIQMELPWELGPSDGRWLLRTRTGEVDRVLVFGTIGAQRKPPRGRVSRRAREPKMAEPEVPVARVTVIDPVPLSAESQAHAWLTGLDSERETLAAFRVLNRVLFAHRIATADPYVHEVFPSQAVAIRAGFGDGEQVAYGRWLDAREISWVEPAERKRVAALRPQERLAVLLSARGEVLQCEEHALRARLDLEHGRLQLAAVELERAYLIGLHELGAEPTADLLTRLAELRELQPGVIAAANSALPAGARAPQPMSAGEPVPALTEIDPEALRHALGRLEAALRARTARGFGT